MVSSINPAFTYIENRIVTIRLDKSCKVVNQGISVGPHVHAMLGWRVQDSTGLSIVLGYDYLRSAFGPLTDSLDAEAHFVSIGLRAETHYYRSAFNPYLTIAAAYGTTFAVVPDPNADPAIRNTAVIFGVGFTLNLWQHTALEPLVRFVISEGSSVAIPLTCSLRWDL